MTALLFENAENPIDNYNQLILCIVYNILYKNLKVGMSL